MFKSLFDFYNSQLWRDFRRQLIADRTDPADGFARDELTGQPILKEWDIIAHHKTELTLQNVNDFSISLNPDNIMLVSHRSHNEIHARFGYACGKKVYYVYGAPCSGKTHYVNSVKGNSDLIVDIDNIWQALTGERYYKPDALKACVFTLHNDLLDMCKTRQGRWSRAYIIAGGARRGDRERTIKATGAEPILIQATEEQCMARLMGDPERKKYTDQWQEYVKDWFEKYQE